MGRIARLQIAGGLYHVTSRGNARGAIHKDDADYSTYLRHVAKVVERFDWRCHSFCLMPNHEHLMIETPEPNLAAGMHVLNLSYARFFNWRYRRVGHVFQGPYRAVPILAEGHLLAVVRYVVLNPVEAGLVADPADWQWTSHRATAGLEQPPDFLQVDRIRSYFRHGSSDGTREYLSFVTAPLRTLDFAA
ncbi:MAG TPA: transposase [Gaiellaceae bacterium]|jgi:Transposase and inactivated derivatives|nr:transposase [Gaiellaceae bacterium]